MLTGPITILQWSFVREDQTREQTAIQIGLAIRDEVKDLVATGSKIVQVDEPAFREGLPLKRSRWAQYLEWASRAFRLSTSGEADTVQVNIFQSSRQKYLLTRCRSTRTCVTPSSATSSTPSPPWTQTSSPSKPAR